MKFNLVKVISFTSIFLIIVTGWQYKQKTNTEQIKFEKIKVEAPFPIPELLIPIFPSRVFKITDYGAKEGGVIINTKSIEKAIQACSKSGGGQVVVPKGIWLTGQVHLRSNINLHLESGAELIFTDNPDEYLPAVLSSWEGIECYNYSPLIYAYNCENLAITGKGTVIAKLDTWKIWYERPQAHMQALMNLYNMSAKGVPVKERQMAVGENHLRPQFIQFNRCKNLLIEGISIRNSPFWTVHILLCDGVVVRGINVYAHGHNNDGLDPEMTRNMLIENCIFDQGDDAIAIKAGKDADGWRLNTPSENIVIRNCVVKEGHQMLAIGSELSGGIKNIYVHDFKVEVKDTSALHNIVFIKTNENRGGFVENVIVENITVNKLKGGILNIATNVVYQYKDLKLLLPYRLTRIENITLNNINAEQANIPLEIRGSKDLPVKNITINNCSVSTVIDKPKLLENVENLVGEISTGQKIKKNK